MLKTSWEASPNIIEQEVQEEEWEYLIHSLSLAVFRGQERLHNHCSGSLRRQAQKTMH